MKRRAELDFPLATLIQVLRHRIRGGVGVQNLGKPDDVILERSLREIFKADVVIGDFSI